MKRGKSGGKSGKESETGLKPEMKKKKSAGLSFPHIDLSRNAGSSAVGYLYQHILQTVFTVIGLTGKVPSGFEGKEGDIDYTIVEGVEDLDVVMKDRSLHIQVKTSEWSTKEVYDTIIYACKYWSRLDEDERVLHEWHFWSLRAEQKDLEEVSSLEEMKESITEASEVHYRSSISLLLEAVRKQASPTVKNKKKTSKGAPKKKKPNPKAIAFLASFKMAGCETYYEESPEVAHEKIKTLSPDKSLKDIHNRLEKIDEAFNAWKFLTTCNSDKLKFGVRQIPLWNEIRKQCIKMLCDGWKCKEGVARVLLSFLLANSCDLLAESQHKRDASGVKSIPVKESIEGRKMEVSKMKVELDLMSRKGEVELKKEYADHLDNLEKFSMSMSLREHYYAEKYAGENFVSYCASILGKESHKKKTK